MARVFDKAVKVMTTSLKNTEKRRKATHQSIINTELARLDKDITRFKMEKVRLTAELIEELLEDKDIDEGIALLRVSGLENIADAYQELENKREANRKVNSMNQKSEVIL